MKNPGNVLFLEVGHVFIGRFLFHEIEWSVLCNFTAFLFLKHTEAFFCSVATDGGEFDVVILRQV